MVQIHPILYIWYGAHDGYMETCPRVPQKEGVY